MPTDYHISSAQDIRSLIPDISLFRERKKKIAVHFAQLSEFENKELEKKIKAHYQACGCGQGRVAGIFTLLAYMMPFVAGFVSVKALGWPRTILYYFAISAVTMFIGKIYGLFKARIQLARLADELASQPMISSPLID